ncbi:hypothetical protein [Streptomyces sp. NPDC020681]|uniref:hypothetical protein n=1 Tax=Streptomyces sp. NPDC020681 TaxID=3365083 RepID=UPI0037A3C845
MRHSPRSGPHRPGRPFLAAFVGCAATAGLATGLTGCAADTGARDGGAAPRLSPPVSSSPLWPEYTPPVEPDRETTTPFRRYANVKGIEAPAGGLKQLPVKQLLEHDPNVPELVRTVLLDCPGTDCGLRAPVHRDLTGDGKDELVVAVDDQVAGLTLIQVYRAFGTAVRPILISWSGLGATGETFGHDLVLTSTGKDGRFTTRYRWNGTELTAAAPQDPVTPEPSESPSPAPRTT